ncbi:ceramide synthase [Anastrepha ludens]|uniref:ceramide synthase n=1 Tax=Anastrepha ludens TaxID=28586 RepID=UPI0023B13A03|nr:ceramide synthase [Anastrepha ludens]XP_053952002.1 ceramide synthase [Anastrepha ludens]XP_053952003.1 ceramide synthase [Anastrepha ludens]XP_053952004.1 ceramide synthase [Anastrepha ludens]
MGASTVLQQRLRSSRCYMSLACSIGSISLACGSLLQIPNITDRISLQRGLFLTSLGFIYFVSLTDFCHKYLLNTKHGLQFRKKYRLMMSDVMEITNKIVSAVQATFSFLVGFIVCKSTCSKSFVYASHFLMEAYGWFGTAYFMYDIWSMYKVHTQKIADKLKLMRLNAATTGATSSNGVNVGNGIASGGCGDSGDDSPVRVAPQQRENDDIYDYDGECVQIPKDGKWDFVKYVITHPVMMIHHVFIGTFGLLVVTYIRGGGHCIYSYMFMMEFSTPFVSMRSILSTMRLKDSRAYIINGLLMLGTFFVFRVFMWPYVMYRYSVAINASLWQALTTLPTGCIISIMILFLPQLYWFFLMVKGALKVLLPPKQKAPATKKLRQSKNNNLSPVTPNAEHDFSQICNAEVHSAANMPLTRD